ncbi:MAG: amidohydrolase [Acidobacteriota bacterium]
MGNLVTIPPNRDELRALTALRRELHQMAELSGAEWATAARITGELEALGCDTIVEGLGGHGVAAELRGARPGPTVLLRADLDALPIAETIDLEHGSRNSGVAHKCGHDGHMTMAVGVARRVAAARPNHGRLVVLFQPAEETGEGAAAVLGDPAFSGLRPDVAIAVHNLPGFELGEVVLRPGPFACASRGLTIELEGATSHAAEPDHGRSPALAVAQIIESWTAARQLFTGFGDSVVATVVHASLGERAFGTSPGSGSVSATIRAETDELIEPVERRLRELGQRIAEVWELSSTLSLHEVFPATLNDPEVVSVVSDVARRSGLAIREPSGVFSWSEDFGHFGTIAPSALIGLGAGVGQPALHHPTYDFPDELIPTGVELLEAAIRNWIGRDEG